MIEEEKTGHKKQESIDSLNKSDLTFNLRCSPQGSFKDLEQENEENEPDVRAFVIGKGKSIEEDDDGLNERDVTNMPLQMPTKEINSKVSQKKKDIEDRLKAFNVKVRANAVP